MNEPSPGVVVAAFTPEQTARLTGVSQRQLKYWATRGVLKPSLRREQGQGLYPSLYTFRDLVALRVLNELRNVQKVQIKDLIEVKNRLNAVDDGFWGSTTLYVLNKRVVVDNPETGSPEEVISGQRVLHTIPVRLVIGTLQAAVSEMRKRDPSTVGRIIKKRGVANSQPVIAGTRIPVRAIKSFAEEGYSSVDIMRQYPSLSLEDIRAALDFDEVA